LTGRYPFGDTGGEIVSDIGSVTKQETDLQQYTNSEDEEFVTELAEKWSINPLQLDTHESRGTGIIGKLPR